MSIPETVMRDRCEGCAFRPGTEASTSPWTQAAAHLCVLSGEPFLCHDGGDGHLCKGFVDAFTVKMNSGYYARLEPWKKELFARLSDALDDILAADQRGEAVDPDTFLKAVRKYLEEADATAHPVRAAVLF